MMKNVILVTGGGRGIGAATALAAARKGYAVAVNYLKNRESADQIVQTIRENGGEALALQADISRENEVLDMFVQLDHAFGPLTVLVNNAGIVAPGTPLSGMTAERMRHVFDVNVIGTMLCSREAVKRMAANGGGSIVNISSIASRLGSPFEYVDYAASKGAIDTFTVGLSKEVAAQGIRVNAVRPGYIDTEIHAPGRLEKLVGTVPLGRIGQAEEIAETVLWLLSEKAAYMTGALVDVTGGK